MSASRPHRIWLGVLIVVVLLGAALIVWAVTRDDGNSSKSGSTGVSPIALSPQGLSSQAKSLGQPIYWAGPKPGFTYEYTQTANGTSYVRYLPPGVDVGDPRVEFLIIATYRFPDALAALKKVSKGTAVAVPGGGIAVVDEAYPKSVHMAFPGVDSQVEVFDPSPKRARAEATSGDIAPVP